MKAQAAGPGLALTEADIHKKEQELTHKINDYYNFDMGKLKAEVHEALQSETARIERERAQKQAEINAKFQQISSLADSHVARGPKYVTTGEGEGGLD